MKLCQSDASQGGASKWCVVDRSASGATVVVNVFGLKARPGNDAGQLQLEFGA